MKSPAGSFSTAATAAEPTGGIAIAAPAAWRKSRRDGRNPSAMSRSPESGDGRGSTGGASIPPGRPRGNESGHYRRHGPDFKRRPELVSPEALIVGHLRLSTDQRRRPMNVLRGVAAPSLQVGVHGPMVTDVHDRPRCGSMKADPADIKPEATPQGASVSSDDRSSQGSIGFGVVGLTAQGLCVHADARRLRWQRSVGIPSGHQESAAVISMLGGSSVVSGPSA